MQGSVAWLAVAACVLAPVRARAQEQPQEQGTPQDPREAEAMQRFEDARALFDRGDHRAALVEMRRVYELLEGSPNQYIVLYNLGRVYEELHRYDLAIENYRAYLEASGGDAPDRENAQASLSALERFLGTIEITTDAPRAEVWIGEWQVGEAPGRISVPAGSHAVELRAEGYESVRVTVEVAARTEVPLDVSMTRLSDFDGLPPWLFVGSTIIAGLAAATGGAFGIHALALESDADECRTAPGCHLDANVRRSEISDFALAADVLFAGAAAFAITSIVLVFLTDWDGGENDVALRLGPNGLRAAF
jgi:tetratricopeptide (TPR) repeat protein